MYAFGYLFVLAFLIGMAYVATKDAKGIKKRIMTPILLGYGLFGLAYGASISSDSSGNSVWIMLMAAVIVTVDFEIYLREFKRDLMASLAPPETPQPKRDPLADIGRKLSEEERHRA
jgi:hypothetical protein